MSSADPIQPVNGKKLILVLGVGAVVFTAVMGYGTYFLAQWMTPRLEKTAAHHPKGAVNPVQP